MARQNCWPHHTLSALPLPWSRFMVSSQSEKPRRGRPCGPRWVSVKSTARSMWPQMVSSPPSQYGHTLLQVAEVAGLAQVGAHADDQPQVVVAEPLRPVGELARQPRPALAGERKDLVPGVAVLELQMPETSSISRACAGRGLHGAQRVLRRIARAHAAPQPGLVGGNEARPVERGAALDRVPEVEHGVHLGVRRLRR